MKPSHWSHLDDDSANCLYWHAVVAVVLLVAFLTYVCLNWDVIFRG